VKIWKVVIAVMLIFGAGVVTGGLLVRTRVAPSPAPASAQPQVMGMSTAAPAANIAGVGPGRQLFVQRVRNELDLTPEQSSQVDQIMRDSHKRMQKIYEPLAPQAREETRRVRQEIQALLTPEQKQKFNEKFKRRQPGNAEKNQRARAETNGLATPQQ
jgi:Spy/CpxP family protein refolding chaperone